MQDDLPTPRRQGGGNSWPLDPVLAMGTVSLVAVVGLGFLSRGTILGFAAGACFILVSTVLAARAFAGKDRWAFLILMAAMIVRLGALTADLTWDIIPKVDALEYHRLALRMSEAWSLGVPASLPASASATLRVYVSFCSVLYYVFGASDVLARLANVGIGVMTVGGVLHITRHLSGPRAGRIAALTYAVLPSVVVWNTQLLRDSIVIGLLVSTFALLATGTHRTTWVRLALAAGTAYGVLRLRAAPFAFLLVGVLPLAIHWIYRLFRRAPAEPWRWTRGRKVTVAVAFGVAVVVVAWLAPLVNAGPADLAKTRRSLAEGGSAYLTDVTFSSWGDVAMFLPLGFAYFMLSPFPWQVHNSLAAATLAENLLLWWPIVALAMVGIRRVRGVPTWAMIAFAFTGLAVYGLVEANVGTAIRHRAQFSWVFFILAAATIDRWWVKREARRAVSHPSVAPKASPANLDSATVKGFGDEWSRFDQSHLDPAEASVLFERYFHIFPWSSIPAAAEGFDLGCGSGRWAIFIAPRVGSLHCVDASGAALQVARRNLRDHDNVSFHEASVAAIPLADGSQDFGYSLGVLHHVPDTAAGLRSCVEKLKAGAPFLVYLYYAFDNRPWWFRALWRTSDVARRVVSRWPPGLKTAFATVVAALCYWPLARLAAWAESAGRRVDGWPLAPYRRLSFYTMRTDALDRFGTRLEQRFTRDQVAKMMQEAGLGDLRFSETVPYWCAVGRRVF